jgi:hypothetical protein
MRKSLIFLCMVLLAIPLAAQQRTGNIFGRVVDDQGNPLPGVTVTLTHTTIAPMSAVTSVEGTFRFISLFPAKDYKIRAELAGFKPRTEEGVIVAVGVTTEVTLKMEMGKLEEEVTVTAVSPVVESKKTAVTQTVDYDVLQSLPSARDPWVILQMTPSVQVDRENVGGNESGQQSVYVAMGGDQYQAQWTLDGVLITDPAARGGSPTYFDFDVFEEMQVTTSGMDVETQLGGIALNLVTRRGGNRVTLGGRFYLTDQKFQSKPTPERIAELGVAGYNQIIEIKDFGFNAGGPVWKDKIWWWGSYGNQEIKTTVITGTRDDTYLNNEAIKLNLQLVPANRAEVFIHAGKKEKFGRSASATNPLGWYQGGKYHFGSPIIKIQDEHMFGNNLFISLKYGFTDAGFGMWPMGDTSLQDALWYNVEKDLNERSNTWFFSGRPNKYYSAQGTYYNDSLLGASHEIKFGVELTDRYIDYISAYPVGPGNISINYNYNYETVDWDADGVADNMIQKFGIDLMRLRISRCGSGQYGVKSYAGFLSDTISFGRFNLKLGLRFDRQHPWVGAIATNSLYTTDSSDIYVNNYYEVERKYMTDNAITKIAALMPNFAAPAVDPDFNWDFFSPRVGLTWDVFGDGKTIAKVSGATYGEYMGIIGGYWAYGGLGGNMYFWWNDVNGDGKADWTELYWASATTSIPYLAFNPATGVFQGNWVHEAGSMWSGFDYTNPQTYSDSYYTVDPNWTSNRTYEGLFTVEREITPDLGAAVDFTYRYYDKLHRTSWYYPTTGHVYDSSDYKVAGTVPATFTSGGVTYDTGDAAGKDWYVRNMTALAYTDYRYRTNWPSDRHNVYLGVDIRFNKRLSNKWMMNGSLTLQQQKSYYGTTGYEDPNNLWAFEGQTYAYSLGAASGKLSQPTFSTWLVKLQGMYQFPYDINASFTFNARQGFIIPAYFQIRDTRLPSTSRQSDIYIRPFGTGERLPTFWNLNFRAEKSLKVSDTGRIFFMFDVFNVFNLDTLNRQYAIRYGLYTVNTGAFAPYANNGMPNEVLNPRVFRLGVRFQFD